MPLSLTTSDIMAFFLGAPDGSTPGHDDLAERIAAQGLSFTENHWRMEDMQSFTFLLLMEVGPGVGVWQTEDS